MYTESTTTRRRDRVNRGETTRFAGQVCIGLLAAAAWSVHSGEQLTKERAGRMIGF